MISKIFYLNFPEKYAWMHCWLADDCGGERQTEVYLDLNIIVDSKSLKEGDSVSYDLAYKNGKYIAENPVKTGG